MKLGFIGVGKIASAIVGGLCTSSMENLTIKLSPRNEANSKELERTFPNVSRAQSNQLVLDQSDVIFVAVLPQDTKDVLLDLKFSGHHTVVSLVPFLGLSELAKAVEPAVKFSRAIPLPTVVAHNCPIPILNSNKTVTQIFGHIGQPLPIDDESQLHALWALTGLIAPFYDLLGELSDWAISNGVNRAIAAQYVADFFQSLSFATQHAVPLEFRDLAKHAKTPRGMNEQAAGEISEVGAHEAYTTAVDHLLQRFSKGH